jgi:hypothetical protein
MLAIEIINQCNFNCYFCGAGTIKEKTEIITLETIKKISLDINELGIQYLKLTPSRGEIFLHPEIYEILDVLLSIDTIKIIEFHTNFSRINFEKLFNLKHRKLKINVSHYGHDGLNEFIYQTRTNQKFFDKVEANIQLAKKLGINIILDPRNRYYDYDCDIQPRKYIPEFKQKVCSFLYCPRIFSNGDFYHCTCSGERRDIDEKFIIGNIYNQTMNELYLSTKRIIPFEQFKTQVPDLCKNCTSYNSNFFSPSINGLKNLQKIKKIVNGN